MAKGGLSRVESACVNVHSGLLPFKIYLAVDMTAGFGIAFRFSRDRDVLSDGGPTLMRITDAHADRPGKHDIEVTN
jgi:hypothetical protein